MPSLRVREFSIFTILIVFTALRAAAQTTINTLVGGATTSNGPALLTSIGPITAAAEDGSGSLYLVTSGVIGSFLPGAVLWLRSRLRNQGKPHRGPA